MIDREKVIDGLERLRFFNQRAGRELWQDKPHDVQEMDIINADAVYTKAFALLEEQEEEIQNLRRENHNILTTFHEWAKEQEAVEPKKAPFPDASRSDGSWYYICGTCSKPIEPNDKFCRWCGKAVKWE